MNPHDRLLTAARQAAQELPPITPAQARRVAAIIYQPEEDA